MAEPQQHTLNEIFRLVVIGLVCIGLAFTATVGGYFLRERAQEQERVARRSNICNSTVNGFDRYIDRVKREFYDDDATPDEIAQVDRAAAAVFEDVKQAILADCGKVN
jgi:hypothetical protein